jgi:hypothetical protein
MPKLSRIAILAIVPGTMSLVAPMTKATAAESTIFSVTIKNVSKADTLKLPDGGTATAPIAPGVFVILKQGSQLFEPGAPAPRPELESLAEDGDGRALLESLNSKVGVRGAGMFVPGQPFRIEAQPGDRLTFASMFVQSNDKFYSPGPDGIKLFDSHNPVAGDLTSEIAFWDAGTERDEPPGAGANQAPRQTAANSGAEENGKVRLADDEFVYPAVADVLQLNVRPLETAPQSN